MGVIHSARIQELDGIRGVAIASVFLFHLAEVAPVPGLLGAALNQGWIGVDIFFVLSGFLITSILIETKGSIFYFRDFYARRILRIFPAYYLLLAGIALLLMLVPSLQGRNPNLYASQIWDWLFLQNWVSAAGMTATPFQHLWSLAIEEQFYLLWPFIVWKLSRPNILRVCLGIVVFSFAARLMIHFANPGGQAMHIAYFSTATRLDCLALGALAATIDASVMPKSRLQVFAACLSLPSIMGLMWILVGGSSIFWQNVPMATVGLSLVGLASLALLLYGLSGSRLLRWSGLRWLGRYSYAFYLLHWPVILGVNTALLKIALPSQALYWMAFASASAVTTCGIALLSWRFVEGPALLLKKQFSSPSPDA